MLSSQWFPTPMPTRSPEVLKQERHKKMVKNLRPLQERVDKAAVLEEAAAGATMASIAKSVGCALVTVEKILAVGKKPSTTQSDVLAYVRAHRVVSRSMVAQWLGCSDHAAKSVLGRLRDKGFVKSSRGRVAQWVAL